MDGDGDGVCSSRIYVKAGGGYGGEGGGGGGGKGSGSSSSKCGRWNPTAEQVKVLTELFKSGLRTPSSDQIQKISHHLSFYGKIESKNVFYWFQNHKARDRQKRRKLNNNNNNSLSLSDQQYNFILPPPSSSTTSSSIPNFAELEAERRMMKTLQLFPLNSIDEAPGRDDHLHFRSLNGNHYEDPTPFSYKIDTKLMDHHPPLDLRLNFDL